MTTVSSTNTAVTSTDATTTTHKTSLDQADFMTILLAQLKYQDPNSPMDDKEMASQLVQYSSLEQLTKINEGITKLGADNTATDLQTGSNYIGKSIKSTGYNLTVKDTTVSTLYYSLGESVSGVTANIYDADGNIVRSESLGSKGKGEFTYVWDGKDTDGNKVTDGTYGVILKADNAAGENVLVQSQISGVVTGVKTSGGKTYLTLGDGRTVDMSNVTEVVATATTTT